MKYLCLVYSNEQVLHNSADSPEDAECMAYAESIQRSGRMIAAEALESVQTATTVRMRGGKLSITDGVRRDQGTTGGLLPDRRQGLERSHPGRRQHTSGPGWLRRGPAGTPTECLNNGHRQDRLHES